MNILKALKAQMVKVVLSAKESAKRIYGFFVATTGFEKLVLAFILASVVASLVYQSLNKAPQIWDSSAHINLSMLYAQKIVDNKLQDLITLSGYYPPLVHLLGGFAFLAVPSISTQLSLTFVFYFIGLVYLYLLVKTITQSKTKALLACAFFSLLPQTYKELRLFQLDLPLTSLLIASFYHLHVSKGLTNGRNGLLFFLFFALAQMTKWYAFVYIPVPFLYEMYRGRFQVRKSPFSTGFIFGLGSLMFLIVTVPWYINNFQTILNFFGVYSRGELNDPQNPLSFASLTEYLKLISVYQLYFINLLTALGFLVFMMVKKQKRTLFYLAAIIVPYAVFTGITNKDVRYVMPLLPVFSMILADGFGQLIELKGKTGLMGTRLFLVMNLALLVFVSFNQLVHLPGALSPLVYVVSGPVAKYQWLKWNPTEMAYQSSDWNLKRTYDYIVTQTDGKKEGVSVLFGVDFPYYNKIEFDTYQILDKRAYKVDMVSEGDEPSKVLDYDFFVTSYNPGPSDLRHYNAMVKLNRWWPTSENTTHEQKTFYRLPNGEDVYILQKKAVVENALEASGSANEVTPSLVPVN